MDDNERKGQHGELVEEGHCQPSPFVMRRREATAHFDERQKQLFDQAVIAILVADLPPERIEQVLARARDITIHVFSGEMLADMRAAPKSERSHDAPTHNTPPPHSTPDHPNPAASVAPVLLSCTSCHGYSLTLRGKILQCDDCGTIQPTLKNVAGRGDRRERNHAEGRAELFDHGKSSEKQIVNVALNGTTLALVFDDGSAQRHTISNPASFAISHLLRVLDTMSWAREALENRLLNLSTKKPEDSVTETLPCSNWGGEQMKKLISMEDAEAQLAREIIDRQKLLAAYSEDQPKEEVRHEITARVNRLKKLRTQRHCDSCGERLSLRDIYVVQSEPGYRLECYDCISQSDVQRTEPIVGEPHNSFELCVAENTYLSEGIRCAVIRCEKCGLTREWPEPFFGEYIFVCDGRTMLWYRSKTPSRNLQ